MILTITANPSVDISYQLEEFNINKVTRTSKVNKDAGGKGIHVGYVLHELGYDVVHSGFVGGVLGEFIEERLKDKNQVSRFIKIKEDTRNCIAILHDKNQTEILEDGPIISKAEEERFLDNLEEISKDCNIINISGSLPRGLDFAFYKKIIEFAKANNKLISVDTSGNTLKEVVNSKVKPDIIKPNEDEIADLLGRNITKEELKEALLNNPLKEIKYVIVSMGKDGAMIKIDDKIYKAIVPKVYVLNPVGSGDSSLAGALSAIYDGKSNIDIIKTSMTCGLLNVLTEEIAHIDMKKFDEYYRQIKVEEL